MIQREKLSTSDIEFIEREFEQSPFKVVKPAPAPAPTKIPAVLSAKSSSTPAQKNLDLSSAGVKAGDRLVREFNGVEFAFRWIPSGQFLMGSPNTEPGRERNEMRHEVTLTKGFWMLETEVTQEQWFTLQKNNVGPASVSKNPRVGVSWMECVEFCEQLSKQWNVSAILPTEAQWEFACRAGTVTPFSFGASLNGDRAVCDGEEPYGTLQRGVSPKAPAPAASKEPNGWGLYDMHGNVSEWCSDWYTSRLGETAVKDPKGPESGSERVVRGGSWDEDAEDCRSASRDEDSPNERESDRGFRFIIVPHVW